MIEGKVTITRGPVDPICTRVSVGGTQEIGHYCVYRGATDEAIAALETVLIAMRAMKESGVEPPVSNINPIGGPGRS